MATGIDHRLQHFVVNDVVAQPVRRRRGACIGQMPSEGRVDDRAAIEQGLPYVLERNAASQTLVVFDDQASSQSVVEASFDHREYALRLAQTNAVVGDAFSGRPETLASLSREPFSRGPGLAGRSR